MSQAFAVLWAQWRSVLGALPNRGVWAYLISALWYGGWIIASIVVGRIVGSPDEIGLIADAFNGALLLVVLYWQVVPILLSATGASLDLQKLKVYPIPMVQLFGIEVMLRTTAAIEMVLLLIGTGIGAMFNSKLPWASPLALVPFVIFNLFLAVGVRDLVNRALRHKRIREIAVLLFVCLAALPSYFAFRVQRSDSNSTFEFFKGSWAGWPWTATANLFLGHAAWISLAWMLIWCAAGAVFAAFQFRWTFLSDRVEAPAAGFRSSGRNSIIERFFRWPSLLFPDPLAALTEKEIRFLARSPRFRLVFLMGFSFGLVIWLPISMGRGAQANGFLNSNYLTVVSVYALLLLSEVCLWNSFGFDRSAAQMYFLAPISFSRVLIAKNVSASFFIAVEIAAITLVCSLAGLNVTLIRVVEAYSVTAIVSLFLLGAGNLLSIERARGVNPDTTFRSGAAGRIQAMLFAIYPFAFTPVLLAYGARYAFRSQIAFFAVLALDAAAGAIVYKLALDSAVSASERKRERMISALAEGDGPIAT
jgi:ABC-2 type transport system permease protein